MKNLFLQFRSFLGANPASFKEKAGFTILYAVITIAAVITIGVSIVGIYQRQTLLVSSSEASSQAFYAADAALECALKWDNREEEEFAGGDNSIECAGDSSVSVSESSCSGGCDYTFELDDTGDANVCAEVIVSKDVTELTGGGEVFDIVDNGVDYRVHRFTSPGTLEINSDREVEYLIVGGGGGAGIGANGPGGGGGGGGVRMGTTTLATGDHPVIVGAGGSGASNPPPATGIKGENGEDSFFDGVTAFGGGGGGGGRTNMDGRDGASGGGGGANQSCCNGDGFGGDGSGSQGESGGDGAPDGETSEPGAGGGGGAGEPGEDANGSNGGDGIESDITGNNKYYAGGGGGTGWWSASSGVGGEGGGGDARTSNKHGEPGTGGGGGGWWTGPDSGKAGNGGSGVVIVRYVIQPSDDDEEVYTQIEARGRNTCEPSTRQAERALRTAY